MSLKLKLLFSALIGVAFALAIIAVGAFRQGVEAGHSIEGPLRVYGMAPNFQLTERSGATVTLADLQGKVWVADFIFTHCAGPCPLISAKMSRLQKAVSQFDDVRLVSFTVDPERDTPEVLSEYARHYLAGSKRWLFLTGGKDQIDRVVGEGFKLALDDGSGDGGVITHSTRLVLVDRSGRIRGYYDGAEAGSNEALLPAIRSLLSD